MGALLNLSKDEISLLESALKENLKAFVLENIFLLKDIAPKLEENVVFFLNEGEKLQNFSIKKVETLSEEIWEKYKKSPGFIYVLKEKVLITPYGFVYVIKKPEEGVFSLEKEKQELLALKNEAERKLEEILKEEKVLKSKLNECRQKLELLTREFEKIGKEIENLKKQKENFTVSSIKLEEQKRSLKEKLEGFETKLKSLTQEKEQILEVLEKLEGEIKENKEVYKKIQQEKGALEKELKEIEKKMSSLYQEIVKIKTQNETLKNRKIELQKSIEKAQNFLRNYKFSSELLLNELEYVKERLKEIKKKKEAIFQEMESINKELEKGFKEKEELEQKLRAVESLRKKKEREIKNLENVKHNLELKLMEKKLYVEAIERELKEIGKEKWENIKEEAILNIDLNQVEEEIEKTKEALKGFQEVNLASIKEFELVSRRYEELRAQKEELEKGIEELKGILRDLKELSKEKILTALNEVNQKLKEVFPVVFPGGEAELSLTEEDPLTAGLDLKIKIPGKNIRYLNMLSGGEKALCVIAILIAFYLVKPGPFCILDEVDAPLDERNALQFIKLLQLIKKKSQIILVTHNPHIMKEVDTLLGVTMEEKGVSKIFVMKLEEFT